MSPNSEMIICYKKRTSKQFLILGLISIIFLVIMVILGENFWTISLWLLYSLVYLLLYFFRKNYPYLTLENDIIKKNEPFGEKIKISEIQKIKKIAGDYILKTGRKEMTIDTQIIEPKSLTLLNSELEKLNVVWY